MQMNHSRISDAKPFPFFAGLTQEELRVVVSAATHRDVPAKTVVTEEGDLATHVFLLVSGRARYFFLTEQGTKVVLHWILPGEVVGAMAILSEPTPYIVSTETVRQTSMLIWKRDTIRRLLNRYPKLVDNSLSVLAQYLVLYRMGHAALVCQDARERLASLLGNLAIRMGRNTPKGIELEVTNEELASAANVTHFTASRLLSDWQRNRLISKTRGRILVFSPAKLFSQSADRTQAGEVAKPRARSKINAPAPFPVRPLQDQRIVR